MLRGKHVLSILLIATHFILTVNLDICTISNLDIRELRFKKSHLAAPLSAKACPWAARTWMWATEKLPLRNKSTDQPNSWL